MHTDLTNYFLIAMPALKDSYFERSLTYICEHSDQGAVGIVVNHPLQTTAAEIYRQLNLEITAPSIGKASLYNGGPVNTERGFVLHEPGTTWESTLTVDNTISVTTSRDILEAIAQNKGPKKNLIALGYAGWAPGQLESEISTNSWLTVSADKQIIFDMNSELRWQAAGDKLGIDLNLLSADAGYA